jgi:hypothetical protein
MGHENRARILHQYGCEIDPVDKQKSSPPHRAAGNGYAGTMRFF